MGLLGYWLVGWLVVKLLANSSNRLTNMFFSLETWVSVPPGFQNPSSIQLLISMKVVTC